METQEFKEKKDEIFQELLRACKLAVRYVSKMVADDIQTVTPPQKCLDILQQAINKAEGRIK